jgi:hypothetical protein
MSKTEIFRADLIRQIQEIVNLFTRINRISPKEILVGEIEHDSLTNFRVTQVEQDKIVGLKLIKVEDLTYLWVR